MLTRTETRAIPGYDQFTGLKAGADFKTISGLESQRYVACFQYATG